ncbi:Precorrin-6Y C5,15-methyltransferase [Candidatus Hodgkinia cicadicola]|uniref:Precorrin-6Y C5,15-methyltransferase n=1 Tax=Candidatus Hodgkinia cicadicola TaxID=573658 RepID=A0A097GZV1_9HYPH|nr:Precorrin-6Y C5,15-methyltransferase [Candidatus Hodgkinia cicadicola]AUG34012.1 Precorrin-6Y C5,15-methyltransferase [Candidatus Hodgkinia cicadicola]
MLTLAMPCDKKSVFLYIKLYCMCKLIVGCSGVRFKPFCGKACVWKSDFYAVLFWVKRNVVGLAALVIAASVWYKSVGQSLQRCKASFYSVFGLPYGAKLINRMGLFNWDCEYKLIASEGLCKLDELRACDTAWFCFVRNRVFKMCCHDFIKSTEFEFVELSKFTAFRRLKRVFPKFGLRCAANHTKCVTRAAVSGELLGGTTLWDLGSGSGGLSLCWCSRGGFCAICFEQSVFSVKACVYNTRLMSRALKIKTQLVELDYKTGLFGVCLPDRVFFGCGLKRFRDWRLVFVHLKFGGRALLISVSNSGCVRINLLNSECVSKSYLLVVRKLKLRLNARLYSLCSSVFVCVLRKHGVNIW